MRLTATYRGGEDPFQGDRTLVLRLVPEGARVLAARVTVSPAAPEGEGDPVEDIDFAADGHGPWGATRTVLEEGAAVAVDFHARRRLDSVVGTGGDATLQADLGGVLVDVSQDGVIGREPAIAIDLDGTSQTLPALDVAGIVLRGNNGGDIEVSRISVRRTALNVTVALAGLGPFLVALGELSAPATSPDFASFLQGFLATAQVEGGVHVVPLVVHSDAIARLDVVVELDVLLSQALLPDGVADALLEFDHGSVPKGAAGALEAQLPPGARVSPTHTAARVNGTFDATRVAVGPLGRVTATARAPVVPNHSQAQPIVLAEDRTVAAFDLLLAAPAVGGRASATVLADADGKPLGDPLVGPVFVELTGASPEPQWLSAALATPFQLLAGTVYWLVLGGLAGELAWAAQPAPPGTPALQRSADGGLSWRQMADAATPAPWAAVFRLREAPAAFSMPIELRSGSARLGLERFEALGRVDFALDPGDLAGLIGSALDATPRRACPSANHLANGDFSRWIEDGEVVIAPEDWEVTAGTVQRSGESDPHARLGSDTGQTGLSQVTPVSPGCLYELEFLALVEGDEATAEVIWLGGDCRDARIDQVAVPPAQGRGGRFVHRGRFRAPQDTGQAEVRFLVPPRTVMLLDSVRLAATDDAIVDGDLRESGDPEDPVPGWAQALDRPLGTDEDIRIIPNVEATHLLNDSSATLTLTQRAAVQPGRRWTLAVRAAAAEGAPAVELRWIAGAEVPALADLVLSLAPPAFDRLLAGGEVPATATEAELRLVVPPGAIFEVREIALRLVEPIPVAVDVVAQAPGRLAVSGAVVAYDVVAPDPPAVPAAGLCTPTPPGEEPGLPGHCDHCPSCGESHELAGALPVLTTAGRPAVAGRCRRCRRTITHLGGPVVATGVVSGAAPALSFATALPERWSRARLVTEVAGIGEVRARRLERAGIRSLGGLAATRPDRVGAALALEPATAERIVADARRLLASDPAAEA